MKQWILTVGNDKQRLHEAQNGCHKSSVLLCVYCPKVLIGKPGAKFSLSYLQASNCIPILQILSFHFCVIRQKWETTAVSHAMQTMQNVAFVSEKRDNVSCQTT